jgi:hypothetical protein
MAKLTYFGSVDSAGILKITNRNAFNADLRDLSGKEIRLTIERKAKRSLNQNAFYWGNFLQGEIDSFKERFGETYRKEQIHDWNKTNFWGTEQLNELTGEIIKIPCSSTEFSKLEWEERLDNIRAWFKQNMDWEIGYPLQQNELELQ